MPGVDLEKIIQPIMEAENAVYTAKNEAAARQASSRASHPPLAFHPRELGMRANGTMAYAYDVKLEDVTARDLHYDPHFYSDICTSNEVWQQSNSASDTDRAITDVYHGSEWREHAFLGAPDFCGETRLGWQGYCDGCDIPNPIGTAAGRPLPCPCCYKPHLLSPSHTTTLAHRPSPHDLLLHNVLEP